MSSQTFNASTGFQIANAGIDGHVAMSEEICAQEKERIRVANGAEITFLGRIRDVLLAERSELRDALSTEQRVPVPYSSWPIWQTIMAVVFVLAGLGFTRMSFEPFGLDPMRGVGHLVGGEASGGERVERADQRHRHAGRGAGRAARRRFREDGDLHRDVGGQTDLVDGGFE